MLAPTGAAPEALRVNADGGNLALNLGAARVQTLSVGASGGNVRLTLPGSGRSSVNVGRGNVTVSVRAGTRGSLDIRAGAGRVLLRRAAGPQPARALYRPRPTGVAAACCGRCTGKCTGRCTDAGRETLQKGPPTRSGLTAPPPFIPPALDVFVDAPATAFTLAYTDAAATDDFAVPSPPVQPSAANPTPDSTSDHGGIHDATPSIR